MPKPVWIGVATGVTWSECTTGLSRKLRMQARSDTVIAMLASDANGCSTSLIPFIRREANSAHSGLSGYSRSAMTWSCAMEAARAYNHRNKRRGSKLCALPARVGCLSTGMMQQVSGCYPHPESVYCSHAMLVIGLKNDGFQQTFMLSATRQIRQ